MLHSHHPISLPLSWLTGSYLHISPILTLTSSSLFIFIEKWEDSSRDLKVSTCVIAIISLLLSNTIFSFIHRIIIPVIHPFLTHISSPDDFHYHPHKLLFLPSSNKPKNPLSSYKLHPVSPCLCNYSKTPERLIFIHSLQFFSPTSF